MKKLALAFLACLSLSVQAHALYVSDGKVTGGGNGTTNINIYTGTNPVSGADEGSFINTFTTISCVGAGITCTDLGNGIFKVNVPGGGSSGGSGGASIAVGTGSPQASNIVATGTVMSFNFSTPTFRLSKIGDSTSYIELDGFLVTPGSHAVFGQITTTSTLIAQGITVNTILVGGGLTTTGGAKITASEGTSAAPSIQFGTSNNSGYSIDNSLTLHMASRGTRVFYADQTGHIVLGPLRPANISAGSTLEINHSGSDPTAPLVRFATPTAAASPLNLAYFESGRDTSTFHHPVVMTSGTTVIDSSVTIRGLGTGLRVQALAGNGTIGTDAEGNFIAGTGGATGSDGFGNPISTRPVTATHGVDASSATFFSSASAMGEFTSTTGFVGASATFTVAAVGASSFTFNAGGSNQFTIVFPTAPTVVGQKLGVTKITGTNIEISGTGDAVGAGTGGGGLTPDQGATTYLVLNSSQSVPGAPNFSSMTIVSVSISSFMDINVGNTGNIGISSRSTVLPFVFSPSTVTGTIDTSGNGSKVAALSLFDYVQRQRPNIVGSGNIAGVNAGYIFRIRDEAVDADKGFVITNLFNGVLITTNPATGPVNYAAGSNGHVATFIHNFASMGDHPLQGVFVFNGNRIGNGNMAQIEGVSISMTDSATGGTVGSSGGSFAINIPRPTIGNGVTYTGQRGAIHVSTQSAVNPLAIQKSTAIAFWAEGANDIGLLSRGRVGIGRESPDYSLAITTPGVPGQTDASLFNFGISTQGYVMAASSNAIPIISACGTAPNGSVRGGGSVFTVTPGGGAPGSCTITFPSTFAQPPHAIATPQTGSVLNTFSYTQPTQTGMTVTETGLGTFTVFLFGQN